MAETTNISWADATLNFWIGCTKIGPACDFCYAELWGKRFGVKWGPREARRQTVKYVSKARRLERLALEKLARGEGAFFCFSNSLSDIFDKEVPIEWLAAAFAAMREAPHVTFLLLTKRPQLIERRSKAAGGLPPNAAIGCTVVNQPEADRDLPWLKGAKERLGAIFAFVSMEPLLEIVDISAHLAQGFIGWVITGGESGPHARITPEEAFVAIQEQCAAAGVPFQHKQNGEWIAVPLGQSERVLNGRGYWRAGVEAAGRALLGVEYDARPVVVA